MTKLLLSVREAAQELGFTPSQVYEHVEAKHFPKEVYVYLGTRIFFKRAALRQWAGVSDRKLKSAK